ncbi:MAG: type II toxin-antitoxin system RelE/ParE family toxin [Verrucomicrobiota bacterium]
MARLIWTEPALQDLEQIADYIALDDPATAKRLVRKIFERVEHLRQFPEMCPVPHDLPDSRYRHLVVKPLRIFYRTEKNSVYLIYIMRAERLLRKEDLEERDQLT